MWRLEGRARDAETDQYRDRVKVELEIQRPIKYRDQVKVELETQRPTEIETEPRNNKAVIAAFGERISAEITTWIKEKPIN